MNKQEFANVMAVLEAGTGKSLKSSQMTIWYEALRDIPLDALRSACFAYLREGDDWPSIAKLRRFAGEPSPEDRAEKAWERLRNAVRRVGAYSTVEFDDPVIHATVRSLGGWELLCGHAADELKWVKREFLNTYQALMATPLQAEQCGPLIGEIDRQNGRDGFQAEEPKRLTTGMEPPQVRLIGEIPKPVASSSEVKRLASSFGVPDEGSG